MHVGVYKETLFPGSLRRPYEVLGSFRKSSQVLMLACPTPRRGRNLHRPAALGRGLHVGDRAAVVSHGFCNNGPRGLIHQHLYRFCLRSIPPRLDFACDRGLPKTSCIHMHSHASHSSERKRKVIHIRTYLYIQLSNVNTVNDYVIFLIRSC